MPIPKKLAWIFTLLGLKNHTVLRQFVFADDSAIQSPFGWPVHIFMVGHDRERGRNAKCAANEDETWLYVYDYGNITYQAVGVMKAVRFGSQQVGDLCVWQSASLLCFGHSSCPISTKLMLPNPPLDIVEHVRKLSKSNNQDRHLASRNL